MAAAIVECLKNPEIVAEAKRTFRDEIKGVEYRPLLPARQQPPVDLNRAMMEKYRPLMAKHYLKEKPVFAAKRPARRAARWTSLPAAIILRHRLLRDPHDLRIQMAHALEQRLDRFRPDQVGLLAGDPHVVGDEIRVLPDAQ